MDLEYVSSGIPGLDDVLGGGFQRGASYLLAGRAGTGKTVSCLHWLHDGARAGERCLYIGLSEPIGNVMRNARILGFDVDHVSFVDLYPSADHEEEKGSSSEPYNVFPPSDVERASVWQSIYDVIEEHAPERLAIDSLTELRYLSPDLHQFRNQIRGLIAFLQHMGCTALLAFESSELERDAAVALAVDGIIRLRRSVSPRLVVGLRSLEVEKLRSSEFISGFHSMRITREGIRIFPHLVEDPGRVDAAGEPLPFGIPNLDRQLRGGLERGTTTILSGQSGVGKSTFAVQFMRSVIERGERAIIFAFEESPASIQLRAQSLGMPVEELIDAGTLEIRRINPIQLYPDEFLRMLRIVVEEDERSVVVIDSLRGYNLAIAEFSTPVANIHNLVSYLKRQQVTTLLINEIEELSGGFVPTELGVSYIADNILLLRYAEDPERGEVFRVVSCLKKRHGPFEPTMRSFKATAEGIQVGEELKAFQNILSSVPILTLSPEKRP